eukprot:m.98407 g.98407  ORF g.98407 m.98407 type:complete len:58 (+) comp20558_c0_seq5:50-223(+)
MFHILCEEKEIPTKRYHPLPLSNPPRDSQDIAISVSNQLWSVGCGLPSMVVWVERGG